MKLLKSMAKSFNSNLNFKKFKKDWNKFKKIYKTFLNLSKNNEKLLFIAFFVEKSYNTSNEYFWISHNRNSPRRARGEN